MLTDVLFSEQCEDSMNIKNETQNAHLQSQVTYLTTEELSSLIKYDSRTIRERLKDSVLFEGVHYIRPFGGRKILYIWEKIEADMKARAESINVFAIPMANGGVCHG
jgi:hypothetical protein